MLSGRLLGLKRRLQHFIAANRRNGLIREGARHCQTLLYWFENIDGSFETNGEMFVLSVLAASGCRVVFDVGANFGTYALMARRIHPTAQIHCFEIVPDTFKVLRGRVAGDARVIANDFGLSDVEGSVSVRYFPEKPGFSSLLEFPHPYAHREVPGRVQTGDFYVATHGIQHIDFLKIDVEGAEGRVLRGFEKTLQRDGITAIQFEYGFANIPARFLLADAHEFLRRHGFVVGKIYPNYVDFRDYQYLDENFLGPNYLAIRSDRHDLLARLR